jgi:hypothetical protein
VNAHENIHKARSLTLSLNATRLSTFVDVPTLVTLINPLLVALHTMTANSITVEIQLIDNQRSPIGCSFDLEVPSYTSVTKLAELVKEKYLRGVAIDVHMLLVWRYVDHAPGIQVEHNLASLLQNAMDSDKMRKLRRGTKLESLTFGEEEVLFIQAPGADSMRFIYACHLHLLAQRRSSSRLHTLYVVAFGSKTRTSTYLPPRKLLSSILSNILRVMMMSLRP